MTEPSNDLPFLLKKINLAARFGLCGGWQRYYFFYARTGYLYLTDHSGTLWPSILSCLFYYYIDPGKNIETLKGRIL